MPRLLLINPSIAAKGLGNISATAFPPLSLPYLAALTPPHYQIEVIDENIKPFAYRDADVVGLTAYTSSVNRAYEIAGIYRRKGVPTVMGGVHVSMLPDEALRYCDTVAIGEAESIWPEILKDFENNRLKPRYVGEWTDLAELPVPRRDVLNNPYYAWGSLQTSRGCPMNCSFCSVSAFNGRRFRRRPLDAVIDELAAIPQQRVMFTDDNIIGYGDSDRDWARTFFEKIIERGIRKTFFAQASIQIGADEALLNTAARAGLRILFVGIESVVPDSLRSYSKHLNLRLSQQNEVETLIRRIRKSGILFLGAFIVGGDEEDTRVFKATMDFVKQTRIDVLQVSKLTPLPGTDIWEKFSREGRLVTQEFPKAWDDYRFSRILYSPKRVTAEEIYEGYAFLKNRYFSPLETLRRTFYTLLGTRNIVSTAIAYKLNQSYRKAFRESDNYHYAKRPGLKRKYGTASP